MSIDNNKAVVRRFYEEFFNRGNLAGAHVLVTPEVKVYHGSSEPQDFHQAVQGSSLFLAAFPDAQVTIEDQIAEGDKVVTSGTFCGTHLRDFEGLPPTGKPIKMTWIGIDRLVEGKITERRVEQDTLGMLQQLGIVPTPGEVGPSEHLEPSGRNYSHPQRQGGSARATAENKVICRRVVEQVQAGNLVGAAALLDAHYVDYSDPPGTPAGPDSAQQRWAMLHVAFPDLRLTIEDMIAEEDKVAVRWTLRGTHQGDLMGLPPTGKQVAVTGIDINRIASGTIMERWANFDVLGMMQQLGAMEEDSSSASTK